MTLQTRKLVKNSGTSVMKLRILNAGQNYRVVGGSDRYLLDLEGLLENKGHESIPFAVSHPDNFPTEWSKYFPDQNRFEQPRIKDIAGFVYSVSTRKKLEDLLAVLKKKYNILIRDFKKSINEPNHF